MGVGSGLFQQTLNVIITDLYRKNVEAYFMHREEKAFADTTEGLEVACLEDQHSMATSQEMSTITRSQKKQGINSSLELLERALLTL